MPVTEAIDPGRLINRQLDLADGNELFRRRRHVFHVVINNIRHSQLSDRKCNDMQIFMVQRTHSRPHSSSVPNLCGELQVRLVQRRQDEGNTRNRVTVVGILMAYNASTLLCWRTFAILFASFLLRSTNLGRGRHRQSSDKQTALPAVRARVEIMIRSAGHPNQYNKVQKCASA